MSVIQAAPDEPKATWLNRNVVGMGLTSLLSDAGHEMATAVLPSFLAVLGVSAAALGAVEGTADAVSSFVKLGAGWVSDRLGHRKPITVGGYFLTGIAMSSFAFARGWPLVLAGRTLGWFGRGIRGPLRDALLSDSVPPEARGKAFGFHRAGDTLGAIIGPLLAVGILAYLQPGATEPSAPFRTLFLLTLIPGLGSGIAFATLVREKRRAPTQAKFWTTVAYLPRAFRRFLWGAGVFGIGDFSHTLMILAATQLLSPLHGVAHAAQIAGLLYVVHNVFYAGASYPVGALSDRWGRRGLLSIGYMAGALTAAGLGAAFFWKLASVPFFALVFALGGTCLAAVDSLEGALTADFVAQDVRGTAYGVKGTVNGVGDLVASVAVGALWTALSPVVAFTYAAVMMLVGGVVIYRLR